MKRSIIIFILTALLVFLVLLGCESTQQKSPGAAVKHTAAQKKNKNDDDKTTSVLETRKLLKNIDVHLLVIENICQRLRYLAVKSANGTYSTGDRRKMDLECRQLLLEIARIVKDTAFYKGQRSVRVFPSLTVSLPRIDARVFALESFNPEKILAVQYIASPERANMIIGVMDEAINAITFERARLGAVYNRLGFTRQLELLLSGGLIK
ncbi:MAG: hypothetical protein GY754_46585 [bacterium]|nr:hypothetical protein [bacterium]